MCILVVEDEALIREMVVEIMLDAGYVVRDAGTGDDAIAMLDRLDPPLSMLLTDVHMPGATDGIALAREVRMRFSSVPIVFMTGRPDSIMAAGPLGAREAVVLKPYMPAQLVTLARSLMAASPPEPEVCAAQATPTMGHPQVRPGTTGESGGDFGET